MSAKPIFATMLLMCAGFLASATRCPDCGSIQVPYPLSTGPTCGDQSYRIRCDLSVGALYFDTRSSTYPISSISQATQRFVVRPPSFLNNNCVSVDISSQGLQVDPILPFSITSGNTVMYFNCSEALLRSPLNCTSTSLCHAYINSSSEASACRRAPICCTFRAGGSTTTYSIRVRDSGCQAYRSFPNLDYSLPVSRWPAAGVEIQWVSPPEPVCLAQSGCDSTSTCMPSATADVSRCFCNSGLHWDAIAGVCAQGDTCGNREDCQSYSYHYTLAFNGLILKTRPIIK